MPSHIYIRVGRYSDAVDSNFSAIEADRAYFKLAPKPKFYLVYYAHNQHFLAYAAMMSGRYGDAIKVARELEAEMPKDNLSELAGIIEGIMPTTFHVLIRFGKWEQVLKEPAYAEDRLVSNAVRHYARSIAYSATGRTKEARKELESFETAMAAVPEEWYVFNNPVSNVLPIAEAMIHGELLYREGKHDEAFAILRKGIEAEDSLVYDEPPGWMLPVRHALGALLMEQGRYEEAEAVYRKDIVLNRHNGWGLLGLQNALLAQGKHPEAAPYAKKLEEVWKDADTNPTSSCFCAPMTASR
jgi:tetratricopeptide (TPR) repeat protein